MDLNGLGIILGSILHVAVPLLYATLGETITERAGIINLSLDGSIMLAAMAGFAGAYLTGSLWIGFALAIVAGAAAALIVAVAHRAYRDLSAAQLTAFLGDNPVLTDVKGIYSPEEVKQAGIRLWRL